jgi:hypothetical protein
MDKQSMKPLSVVMMLICLIMTLMSIHSNETAFTIMWSIATALWVCNIQVWWSK